MTVSKAPDTHAYDVLGVSHDASAQQIDDAYHRLIDEGGYRTGVPLRGQWLRAREIKEAYATLRGPHEQQAYDESLEEAPERLLWSAGPDNHPTVEPLVRPISEGVSPPEPRPQPTTAALSSGDGEREYAPVRTIEAGNEQIVAYVDQCALSPEDDSSLNEFKYGSAKLWGSTAAATLAVCSLFYFSWPIGILQPSPEVAAELPAGAPQVSSGAPMTARLAKLPPAVVATPGATEAEAPKATTTEVASANKTQTLPGAAPAPEAEAASATAPAIARVSSGQAPAAADVAATADPVPALPLAQAPSVAPPAPDAAPPQVRTSVAVPPAAGVISSPAKLIGGGPTNLDNRRGRYVGSLVVQFTVQADGRVSNCGPARSSGKADLDALTCRLVEERMQFKPALDAQGNPVASTAHARYEWGRRRRYPSLFSWIFR